MNQKEFCKTTKQYLFIVNRFLFTRIPIVEPRLKLVVTLVAWDMNMFIFVSPIFNHRS